MRLKVRGDVKLQFRASKTLNNVQDRRYTTIWKMRFSEYFRWSIFFLTHYVREKKNDREKSRKHAKLCGKKTEEISISILVPLTAQPTLGINKRIDFEKWDFSIFSIIHLFLKTHNVQRKKRSRKNRENMLNYAAKHRGDLKLHFSAINSSTNSQNQQENRLWKMRFSAYFRWSIVF